MKQTKDRITRRLTVQRTNYAPPGEVTKYACCKDGYACCMNGKNALGYECIGYCDKSACERGGSANIK